MRPLSTEEETLLARHVALTRTVARYELFARRLRSTVALQRAIVTAIESRPAGEHTQADAENVGRLLRRTADRVPQIGPARTVAEGFAVLRDANRERLEEALRS